MMQRSATESVCNNNHEPATAAANDVTSNLALIPTESVIMLIIFILFAVSDKFNVTMYLNNRGPGLGEARGPAPINRGPPTKPFQFNFSLMIDAYETTT